MTDLEKFERYNPVNPLPEEIRSLSSEETVCKFCGVSYLIHNEIKRLEQELDSVRAQLADYQEMKSKFSEVECRNEELSEGLGKCKKQCVERERMVSELSGGLRDSSRQCDALKEEYSSLNERWEKQAVLCKQQAVKLSYFEKSASLYPPILKQLGIVKEQKTQCTQEIKKLKDLFAGDIKALSQYIGLLSSSCQKAESQLKESVSNTKSLKSDIDTLTKKNSEQSEKLLQERDRLAIFQRSSASLNHAQQQNVQLSKLVSETQVEIETCKQDLSNSEAEKSIIKGSLTVKSQENTELKQRLCNQTRQHTAQIEDLNKKYRASLEIQASLKHKINSHIESMVKDKEHITSQSATLETENSKLRMELNQLTRDLQVIEQGTRDLSESHRIQLSDLHVSYQEQLKSALAKSNTYKNEIDKLEGMRNKHDAELKEALKHIHSKHEAEIREIEKMYRQSQADLEKQIDKLSTQYSKDLWSKEQAIKEIERSFTLQSDTLKADKSSLTNSVYQLNKQIAEYETTIKQLECRPPEPRDESGKLRSLKSRNAELEGEVLVLQKIVQRECEERMELTEKLDQLGTQVCDKKVRENSEVSSRKSVASSSSQTLLKTRAKTENGLNQNARHPRKKLPQAHKYSNWIQK